MPSQETIDRNTRAVKDALKREGNRRCADCAARGPTVACIAFRTFVCQPCANAHRELFPDNKLKSVSLAEFETDEVRGLRQHGNEASRKIWLARWAPSDGEPPAGACDLLKLDVQGAELRVLQGAARCLAQAQAVLLELSVAGTFNAGAASFAEHVTHWTATASRCLMWASSTG